MKSKKPHIFDREQRKAGCEYLVSLDLYIVIYEKLFNEKRPLGAFELLEKMAEAGHPLAEETLGKIIIHFALIMFDENFKKEYANDPSITCWLDVQDLIGPQIFEKYKLTHAIQMLQEAQKTRPEIGKFLQELASKFELVRKTIVAGLPEKLIPSQPEQQNPHRFAQRAVGFGRMYTMSNLPTQSAPPAGQVARPFRSCG